MNGGVTAVVIAWRSAAFLDDCLDSLACQDYPGGVRVVVVDNDADAATRDVLARRHDVRVIRSDRNLGFAGGVALALARVTTRWVFVLNDDAVAAPDAVRLLVAAAGPGVASVQPAVRLAGTRPMLTNSTGLGVSPDGYGYDRDWLRPWGEHGSAGEPFGASGSAMLLDAAAAAAVGGMDPRLFLYYEDLDLAWRLRLGGHRSAYMPSAVVDHRHAASSGEGSPLFRYYNERNRLLVLARNASLPLVVAQWLRYPATTLSLTLARGPRRAQTLVRVRAGVAALRMLPSAVAARRAAAPPSTPRREVQAGFLPPPASGSYRT